MKHNQRLGDAPQMPTKKTSGTLFWITGLSGAGKTTLAKALYARLSPKITNLVLLDGDHMRAVFGHDLGYSPQARLASAERYSRLCKLLCDQGIHVICATISLFHKVHRYNREQFPNYIEIYLSLPDTMKPERNAKGLYDAVNHRLDCEKPVLLNDQYQAPENPDFYINCEDRIHPETLADSILNSCAITDLNQILLNTPPSSEP